MFVAGIDEATEAGRNIFIPAARIFESAQRKYLILGFSVALYQTAFNRQATKKHVAPSFDSNLSGNKQANIFPARNVFQ